MRDLSKRSTYDPTEAEARRPRPAEAEAPAPDLSYAGRAFRRHRVHPPDRMYSIPFSVFYHFSAIIFSSDSRCLVSCSVRIIQLSRADFAQHPEGVDIVASHFQLFLASLRKNYISLR